MLRTLLAIGWLGLVGLPARAQDVPPRFEQRLSKVAPPPGGLVPYRQGRYWGYADTTGRVVVAPMLLGAPPFSPAGFVRVDAYYNPAQTTDDIQYRDDDYAYFDQVAAPQERMFVNARGDFMRVGAGEVALVQPDGSLLLRPRYATANAGQLELLDVSPAVGVTEQLAWRTPPAQLTTRRLGPAAFERRLAKGIMELEYPLAPDRWAYATQHRVYGNIRIRGHCGSFRDQKGWHTVSSYQALLAENGQLLTGYRYRSIAPFRHGLAVAMGAGRQSGYGLLDRQGHEVLPTTYAHVAIGGPEGAVVRQNRDQSQPAALRYGLVNQQGQWTLPLQADPISDPDGAGLVRRRHTAGKTVEFLTLRGQPAFAKAPKLRQATGFWQGRAWALTDAGPGLLDAHGRWVVAPGRYDVLQDMYNEHRHLGQELDREDGPHGRPGSDLVLFSPGLPRPQKLGAYTAADYDHPDTTYLVVRRAGRYGLVSRTTGQEVLPCRYNQLTCWIGDYGSGIRDNQPFLLAARGGRELAAGTYRGDWYDLPGRGPLFQVHLSPYRWLMVDSSGRRATALLPSEGGPSFLTPENLVLLSKPDPQSAYRTTQALADTAGRVLLDHGGEIEYSGNPSWINTVYYWGSSHERPATFSHAFVVTEKDGKHLVLARNGQLRDATGHAYGHLQLLAGGWHLARYAGRSVLISPEGTEMAAPEGYEWDQMLHQKGRLVPFANGTASVAESGFHRPVVLGAAGGLVTRGGRRLWAD